jgi:UDP-glucuronate 4-epimerase
MTQYLVTGAAGFIGMHVAKRLLENGAEVVGLDNINDYYTPKLKEDRLEVLGRFPKFSFHKIELADSAAIAALFAETRPQIVIHLAAQAGVRYSLQSPETYIKSNVAGFLSILEACRHNPVEHLVYASSSSVYGANTKVPFAVSDNVDHPVSLYAATKKSNELMAHTYSHLFRIPTTGLRFFTVYGPWGRPDMAPFLFTRAIAAGEPINVFGEGKMQRDFTYIDDVVEAVLRIAAKPAQPPAADEHRAQWSSAPYAIYNIGNHAPVELMHFISLIEQNLGRKAEVKFLPMQPGDVPATYADVADLKRDFGFEPATPIEQGMEKFVEWYASYYGIRVSS